MSAIGGKANIQLMRAFHRCGSKTESPRCSRDARFEDAVVINAALTRIGQEQANAMATRDLLDHNAFAPFSVRDCALVVFR
jgi:hypothetical protein